MISRRMLLKHAYDSLNAWFIKLYLPIYGAILLMQFNLDYTFKNFIGCTILGALILFALFFTMGIIASFIVDKTMWYHVGRKEFQLSRWKSFKYMCHVSMAISDNRLLRREIRKLKFMDTNRKVSREEILGVFRDCPAGFYPELWELN